MMTSDEVKDTITKLEQQVQNLLSTRDSLLKELDKVNQTIVAAQGSIAGLNLVLKEGKDDSKLSE